MVDARREIFRKESLERLSSPEQLDQLMQVVDSRSWIPLTALGGLTCLALVWSVVGRIPVTVTGQGVLVHPHKVVSVESQRSGQVVKLAVEVGDVVEKGAVIAVLDPNPELAQQLSNEREKLADLKAQAEEVTLLQEQRIDQEVALNGQQRDAIAQRLEDARRLTPILRDKGLGALQQERKTLQQNLQAFSELLPVLEDRLQKRQEIADEGALSSDVVLQARQEYLSTLASFADAESRLEQLEVREADAERQFLSNLSTIADLEAQMKDLTTQSTRLQKQTVEESNLRQNQIQSVRDRISELEVSLEEGREIRSEYAGTIVELVTMPGQLAAVGRRVATLSVQTPSDELAGVAYFSIADGKQIEPGMDIQITPSTVKREQFGGILGSVVNVSPLPTTTQAATALVGDENTVQSLMSNGRTIEVMAQLEADPETYSGYAWSSSTGPKQTFSPATTTTVRVRVKERSPISYVLPILRSLTDG